MDELRQSYEDFPYESNPFAQTHPDRLATVGCIFGMQPAPVGRCRVLEVGCASGGNLLPVAAALPSSEFIGIDFSNVQIERGQADLSSVGLDNARLLAMDLLEFDETLGTFDYIIAHGVYSWVPAAVRDKLLDVCARHLARNGIAYVSYNALPGWGMRGIVRGLMQYHTGQFREPRLRVQQARAMLDFLSEATKNEAAPHALMLRQEAEELRRRPDYYVFHEHLEVVNEAVYFHEFVEHANRHGLRYLAEAQVRNMFTSDLSPEVAATLARVAPDLYKREQLLDFIRNRTFRETLLVHQDIVPERKLSPLRVTSLYAASDTVSVRGAVDLAPGVAEEFRDPRGFGVTTAVPVCKAALVHLTEQWPQAIAFDALLEHALKSCGGHETREAATAALASMLLTSYAAGALELHASPSPFVLVPGSHPAAGRWQRHQADAGERITTLRHQPINVDPTTRTLLGLLDGVRTRADVAALAWPGAPVREREMLLEQALPQIARQALLVA